MEVIKVEILGREFLLRSEGGEAHVRRVADHLNARLGETMATQKTPSTLAAAVLAALNITNELLLLKDQQEKLLREIEDKSERLLEKIEQGKDR